MNCLKMLTVVALALTLFGCATSRTQETQVNELKTRINELETQLQQKNEEVTYLEGQMELMQKSESFSLDKTQAKRPTSKSSKKTIRNIQLALKNAGYYIGPIDGKIGKKTKGAIKGFQKGNGLIADGIVGKETWTRLKRYLN